MRTELWRVILKFLFNSYVLFTVSITVIAEVWEICTIEINKILYTEMDVLRRSARK
jgi:hypothetical protein